MAHCRMSVLAGSHCAWHQHWLRVVGAGTVGRQQYEEFCEWWEQFQPYGPYGDQHGPWWAAVELLWPALTGEGDPPVMTATMENELLLRRAEVRWFVSRVTPMTSPWPRVAGLPLPQWEPVHWQERAAAWRCGLANLDHASVAGPSRA